MKNNRLLVSLVSLAAISLVFASCKKEENGERLTSFYASSENGNSKTHLSGTAMCWDVNDSVSLWGAGDSRRYIYKAAFGGTNYTRFDYARTGDAPWYNAPFFIGYPACYWTSKNVLTLPATQKYIAYGAKYIPQFAYSDNLSSDANFYNVCGLVKLNLTKANTSVSSITISTDRPVHGNFYVNNNFTYNYISSGGNIVTLVCNIPQSISSSKDFYIYLPPAVYTLFEIVITTSDNRTITKRATGSISVGRSKITTITLRSNELAYDDGPAPLPGVFSVSTSRLVRFAPGNLQCFDGQWEFAEHQYDYIGSYSSAAWDLFGWSTETTDFGMSTSTSNSDYSSSFWDWGTAVNHGGASLPWRTMTDAEWTYLLSGRPNASNLWGMATITTRTSSTVRGLVLLPDNWTSISSVPFTPRGSVNANQLSQAQWQEMETNGAVFLPAAGNRSGSTLNNTGVNGNYWTATSDGSENAFYMGFASATVSANRSGVRRTGRAVRLVQNAN